MHRHSLVETVAKEAQRVRFFFSIFGHRHRRDPMEMMTWILCGNRVRSTILMEFECRNPDLGVITSP